MVSIIPLSIAQRRLDTGNAPQYPQGSPVGSALQGFGDQLSAVAERYQQMKDQQDAFDAEIARRRFDDQIAQAETDVAANAPPDGAGLHDAMYGQVDPRSGQVVKSGLFDGLFDTALPSIPASQRANFARQREPMRMVGARRMALRQRARRDDYELAEWTKVDNISTSAIAQGDPNDTANFEAIRRNGFDLIAKIGNPLARQAAEVAWRTNSAKALAQAMIAQDPKRALQIFGVGTPASGREATGDTALGGGSSFSGSSKPAAGKGDRVGRQTPDEMVAQAFRDDLPHQEQAALVRQAEAANTARQVEIRTNIGLAEQNAPDAIAQTGAYSGKMPGRDAFRIAYGLDEGDKRFRDFDWRVDVGGQVFGMRTMPNHAIHAALRDADSGPNGSPEDQARREATTVAVGLVMNHRRADGGGYVSEVFPNIGAAWKAVIGGGLEDPNGYDKDAFDKAIAMSVAAQEQLGIENPQPVPLSIIRDLSENYDSRIAYQQDKNARVSTLLAGMSGPVARAAVARQLADADLGWIIPLAGYKAPSTLSVFASDVKALGKAAANAGIALANANDWVAYGMSGGTISPPDYKDAYYKPANRVENLTMQQGADALGWAIPWPGFGRAAESAIPRAIELVGSEAAGRAELPIGSLEAANTPTSKIAPDRVEELGAGKGAPPAIPAKPQPEDFSKQPTRSLDAVGELPVTDANALSGVTTPSPAQGGRQTTRSPRKSKLDRKMIAEVARELFARDPNRVEHPGAKFGEATTNNYRKGYAQANPDVNVEDLVIHHPAEQQLLKRFLDLLSEKKVNSVENLRGIPKDLNDILHLVILRAENNEFYAKYPNPTVQQVLDHSTMMDKKYGHHFVPPVGKDR